MYNKNNMEIQNEEERIKREQRKMRADAKRNAAKLKSKSGGGGGIKAGKGFAIMRIQKLKTFANISGSANHVHRVNNTPNANPELTQNNRILVGSADLVGDVKAYLDANITARKPDGSYKIRKDNVLCTEHVLTASPEFFASGDKKALSKWVDANITYLKEQHGSNLIHAVLHLDETTPHIHAYTVPLHEGKLNQKHFTGTRAKIGKAQDNYAKAMQPLGLTRGVKHSKAQHTDIKQFYSTINEQLSTEKPEFKSSLMAIFNPKKTFEQQAETLITELITTKKQLNALQASMGNSKKRALAVNGYVNKAKKQVNKAEHDLEKIRDDNQNLRTINNQLVQGEAQVAEQLALYKKYEAHIKELEEQQRLEREQALTKQQQLEQQAMRAEYYKNNKNERGLSR